MRFPNAYKGVKKLFIAEIISIIVEFVALTSAILAAVAAAGVTGLAISAGSLALGSGIAMIVVFVIQLIGLFQGGRDSSLFRVAIWLVVIGIATSLTSAVLQSIEATKGLPAILFTILNTVSTLANFFVIICILYGIASLAEALKDHKMEAKGRRLAFYIVFLYILSVIFGFLPGLNGFQLTDGWKIAFSIFGIVALVLELLIYINVVIYLYRATKMLKK